MFTDSVRNLLGFCENILYKEYNFSTNPVDIFSSDNNFIQTDIAKGMIFKGKRSGILMKSTMSVSPGNKFINRFEGGAQWYMMESKEVISRNCFKLKNENNQLVSFNGNQSHSDYQSRKNENFVIRISIRVFIQEYTTILSFLYLKKALNVIKIEILF